MASSLKGVAGFHAANGSGFSLQRRETYAYEAERDFLTGVDYNDGLANEVRTWTYDAAGNRASDSALPGSWNYDNLNRITSSPFGTYTHNLIGNRITGPNGQKMWWDTAGRMHGLEIGQGNLSSMDVFYKYRADGMRLGKYNWGEGAGYNFWLTRYDGQMPIEEAHYRSGIGLQKLSRNLIGARSIEAIQTTVGSTTTTAYPLYDLMGNMKATLSKSGSTFSTTNWRQWDAWGELRSSDGTGGPSYGYVANLGHPGDAEGSLTYMRARYYEAATGRFVSQDPANDGHNWFLYCNQQPTMKVDYTGKVAALVGFAAVTLIATIIAVFFEMGHQIARDGEITDWHSVGIAGVGTIIACLVGGLLVLAAGPGLSLAGAGVAAAIGGMAGNVSALSLGGLMMYLVVGQAMAPIVGGVAGVITGMVSKALSASYGRQLQVALAMLEDD